MSSIAGQAHGEAPHVGGQPPPYASARNFERVADGGRPAGDSCSVSTAQVGRPCYGASATMVLDKSRHRASERISAPEPTVTRHQGAGPSGYFDHHRRWRSAAAIRPWR